MDLYPKNNKDMLVRFLFLFSFFLSGELFSQTQISGTINQYARFLGPGVCPNSILVDNPGIFSPGSAILIIQMQGAVIDESNNASFGTITNLGSAGNYEINAVFSINGNELILEKSLLGPYSAAGKTQVVKIPRYADALVSGTVTAGPWNGETGGVIALEVTDSLVIQASIDASGMGFRGGVSVLATDINCTFLTANSQYYYEAGNWRGAPKGEGIAPFISGKEYGRGAQANGGGGGNNHNAGGGGGSNGSVAGQGGENDEPSFGGCDGFYPGKGGLLLPNQNTRLFLGGGGGAGHQNNEAPSSGGNGGGIILIKAGHIVFAGGGIKSNGLSALNVIGDGAGGGGGGGSIVLEAGAVTGTPVIEAKGGNGGSVDNSGDNRCQGPGGGGSGGRILSAIPLAHTAAGGIAGQSFNSDACPDGNNGATNGGAGIFSIIPGLNQSEDSPAPAILAQPGDTTACDGVPLLLAVNTSGEGLSYQWQIRDAAGMFVDLAGNAGYTGVQTSQLQINALSGSPSVFRLKTGNDCFGFIYSDPITIISAAMPEAGFEFEVNGLAVSFTNTSVNSSGYIWSSPEVPAFSSTAVNPNFTFPAAGSYEVVLTAANDCGQDQEIQTILVGQTPKAAFGVAGVGLGCAPLTVTFQNQSTGVYDTFQWQFPGGMPATSDAENPVVTYTTPGEYDVTLGLNGPLGESISTQTGYISVFDTPLPGFTWSANGLTVSFINQSAEAGAYSWNFGDGQTSFEENPVHTYAQPGIYDITLNAQNSACGVSLTQSVLLQTNGLQHPEDGSWIVFPNPVGEILYIRDRAEAPYSGDFRLLTIQGILLRQGKLDPAGQMDFRPWPAGIYILELHSGLIKKVALVVKL